MQANYILAGFLNNATEPAKPVIQLCVAPGYTPDMIKQDRIRGHSKGTTYSCAVHAADLRDFLEQDSFEVLVAQLAAAKSLGWEAEEYFRRFVTGLLTAGALMAQSIPDFNTLVPPLKK